jgi:DsbC/DsbD-like thiol-disulfide interchange protein
LSAREVDEIASSPRGVTVDPTVQKDQPSKDEESRKAAEEAVNAAPAPSRSVDDLTQETKGTSQNVAKVTRDGKVEFEKPDQKS